MSSHDNGPESAADFERRAAECAQRSLGAPTPELKEQYAELSKAWARLAKERREAEARSDQEE